MWHFAAHLARTRLSNGARRSGQTIYGVVVSEPKEKWRTAWRRALRDAERTTNNLLEGNPAITVPKEGIPVLSAQAQEMIELLTACQRRIVFYLVVGFLTGFVFGVSVAWIMTR